jgi:uncharacterized Tic20 family protein
MNTNIPSDVPQSSSSISAEERNWATIAHLSALAGFVIPFGNILGPLIVWLVKKDQSAHVADAGREALNFNITVGIAALVSFCLMLVFIGFLLFGLLAIAWLVLVIVAGVKSSDGTVYRYPFNIRFIK